MSDPFEQALLAAIGDLNHGRLNDDPDFYLRTVPAGRHAEFTRRLSALMAARGPRSDEQNSESFEAALAAVAAVRASGGPVGILPGALRQLRKVRGIERDSVIDALAAEYDIGTAGRQTLQRYYHQLEMGTLIGPKLSHRLLRSLASIFDAPAEDFIAAVRPVAQPAPQAPLRLAPAMGRSAGGDERSPDDSKATRGHTLGPDPDVERVEQLFCGGPAA